MWESERKFDSFHDDGEYDDQHDHNDNEVNTQQSTVSSVLSSIQSKVNSRGVFDNAMTEQDIHHRLVGLRIIRDYMNGGRENRDSLHLFIRQTNKSKEVFGAYVFFFLSCVFTKSEWESRKVEERVGNLFSIFDEALIMLFMLNSWDAWVLEARGEKIDNKRLQKEYTWKDDTIKRCKVRGWNKEGLKKYNNLVIEVKELRKEQGQIELEQKLIQEFKNEALRSKGKKRKRRHDATESDESDDEDELIDPYAYAEL